MADPRRRLAGPSIGGTALRGQHDSRTPRKASCAAPNAPGCIGRASAMECWTRARNGHGPPAGPCRATRGVCPTRSSPARDSRGPASRTARQRRAVWRAPRVLLPARSSCHKIRPCSRSTIGLPSGRQDHYRGLGAGTLIGHAECGGWPSRRRRFWRSTGQRISEVTPSTAFMNVTSPEVTTFACSGSSVAEQDALSAQVGPDRRR